MIFLIYSLIKCSNILGGINLYINNKDSFTMINPNIEKKYIENVFFLGNLIEEIPDEICQFKNVKKIFAVSNNLVRMSEQVGKLPKLKELTLSNFTIDEIDNSIKNLKNLEELNITSDKTLRDFSLDHNENPIITPQDEVQILNFKEDEFQSLEKLEIIIRYQTFEYISFDKYKIKKINKVFHSIKNLPNEMCLLKNLKIINICGQSFTTLPESFGNLVNLEKLVLCDNPIKKLPISISKLQNLEEIRIIDHKLNSIPESFSSLLNLKKLTLQREYDELDFERCDGNLNFDFSKLKNLKRLNLKGFKILRIHKSILELRKNKLKLTLEIDRMCKDDEGDFIGFNTINENFTFKQ